MTPSVTEVIMMPKEERDVDMDGRNVPQDVDDTVK